MTGTPAVILDNEVTERVESLLGAKGPDIVEPLRALNGYFWIIFMWGNFNFIYTTVIFFPL